jgi:hypothetical protein
MTVSGRDLDDESVSAAVTEAGYDLAA